MASNRRKRRMRATRSSIVLRSLAVGALALVAVLYYRPLRTYVDTRHRVERQEAEVASLRARKNALERRLAVATSEAALLREARRLSYVKPDEQLFIVKGIGAVTRELGRSIGGDG
jgi:cell division protein FtsB